MRADRIIVVLALLAVLALWSGCMKSPFAKTEAKEENKEEEAVPVEVATLVRGPIQAVVRSSTHLETEEQVQVSARTSNRVTELLVEEGDHVEDGDVLVKLDDDIQRTAYNRAVNNVEKAQKEFERQKALYDQNLISEKVFTDLQFELRQLELVLEDAQRQLEYTEVRAPIRGTVSRRTVRVGDLVNMNQPLFEIVDFDSMVALVYLPEKELGRLTVAQSARVTSTALPGEEFTGYIKRISPIVESRTGTVKVTVAFKEIGNLRPGMYVDLAIVTATEGDALLLSKRSLVYDADQIFAFRLVEDRKVERVLVKERITDRFNVQPVSGFSEGDQIVVAGQTGLKDGARVRLPGDPDPSKKDKEAQEGGAEDPGGEVADDSATDSTEAS